MRGARLTSSDGETLVAGRHVMPHLGTVLDAVEEAGGTGFITLPVPFAAAPLRDLLKYCELLDAASSVYVAFGEEPEGLEHAASLAWATFSSQPLSSSGGRTPVALLATTEDDAGVKAVFAPLL
jgi:hypothetical protein